MRRKSIAFGFVAAVSVVVGVATWSKATAALQLSVDRLSFYAHKNGSTPPSELFKTIELTNSNPQAVNWVIVPSTPWVFADPNAGSTVNEADSIAVGVDVTQLSPGAHMGTVTVWDVDTLQPMHTLEVFVRVCEGTCVFVDVAGTSHTVSPLLFGSQIEWLNSGTWIWDRPLSATCDEPALAGGAPRPVLMNRFAELGVRMLRYPGGTPSDFFHWSESVGPVSLRTPQINPWSSTAQSESRECPVFGPDEFAQVASELQAPILITANAGTGTAQEAADWLAHYLGNGVPAGYWEIGNEVYIPGFPVGNPDGFPYFFARAYMPAAEYAAAFDEYARALRALDPNVKVGLVATAGSTKWSEEVLANVRERADFMAIHLLQPVSCALQPSDSTFRAMLAAPELMTAQLDLAKQSATQFAAEQNKNMDIAVTEHGTLFLSCGFFPFQQLKRNRTLASALYSALSYHVFMRDPRVTVANSLALSHPSHQAPFNTSMINGFSFPLRSAFYHVFRMYAQTVAGTMVRTSVQNAPTYSTEGLGSIPPLSGLPVLDTVAVLSPDGSTLRVFVVNRSLSQDVTARVAFDAFPQQVQTIGVAVLNGGSYQSVNSLLSPNAVTLTTFPVSAGEELEFTFPAHSLVQLTIQ